MPGTATRGAEYALLTLGRGRDGRDAPQEGGSLVAARKVFDRSRVCCIDFAAAAGGADGVRGGQGRRARATGAGRRPEVPTGGNAMFF